MTAAAATIHVSDEEGEEMVLQEDDLHPSDEEDEDEAVTATDASTAMETLIETATTHKDEGNAHFSNQKYKQAMVSYGAGLATLAPFMKSNDEDNEGDNEENDEDNTTNNDTNDNDNQEVKALVISLHSNSAQACLKLHHPKTAEQHCTTVIQDWDADVPKVWYRRACAREKMGLLPEAMEDFKLSVRLLQAQNSDEQMKKTALQGFDRVRKLILKHNKNNSSVKTEPSSASSNNINSKMNGHAHHNAAEMTPDHTTSAVAAAATMIHPVTPPPTPIVEMDRPLPEEQKQAVTKLLISRSVALQKNPQARQGEALFLVDWNWWSQWCRHVDLFSVDTPQKADRMMALLPSGAILPAPCDDNSNKRQPKKKSTDTESNDSNDDTSMESSDSEEDEDRLDNAPPGPINNSLLLMSSLIVNGKPSPAAKTNGKTNPSTISTQTKFYQQWYRTFRQPTTPTAAAAAAATATADEVTSMECDQQDTTNSSSAALSLSKVNDATLLALRPNLVRGFHYEVLPREVYCALKSWYREVTPSICRRTVLHHDNSDGDDTLAIDLYPSLSTKNELAAATTTTTKNKCAACRARTATKRCTRCLSVWYCDRSCQEAHWVFHKVLCSKIAKNGTNGNSTPPLPLTDGRVGLNQLGNTCFMNSALQSLSHATPLTRHFLSNQFQKDLNPDNPLGTGGKLANAYFTTLKELWWGTGGGATSPTALKRAIALFAPRFAGCLQHDAQEFLAYLLDGLHEDLNRIREAPYVEMPDFDNIQDTAHTRVAASKAWECHLKRNDSLVMDTFYGQFKSTCVCPSCSRISVSFDAFNHVSLEIPTPLNQATVWVSLFFFPDYSDGKSTKTAAAVRYAFGFRRSNMIADLRQALSQLTGVPTSHLILCEVSDCAIVEILNENKPITSIRQDEILTAYQVDPYTESSIHVVANHTVVEGNPVDGAAPVIIRDAFGFPFLNSCSADLTCRQLFDHIWGQVRHLVVPLVDDGDEEELDTDLEDAYRQLLRLKVMDSDQNPNAVFPIEIEEGQLEEGQDAEEEPLRSPYVPPDLDEKISTFIGEDCTTRFLFLSLEWTETMPTPPEFLNQASAANTPSGSTNNKKKKKTKKNNNKAKIVPETIQIFEKRFLKYEEHPCYLECIKRKREMDAVRGVSLDQCFETFTKPERLDENNMWYCSSCKEHVRALKTMQLWRLPNILVVHLKRFEFGRGFRRDKLSTYVDFPLDGLDMNKHCAQWNTDGNPPEQLHVNDCVPAMYDLFAVVNHYGRMGFGHYTNYARQWDEEDLSNDWALFDDSSVRSVGPEEVVSPAAYVLFYRRRIFT